MVLMSLWTFDLHLIYLRSGDLWQVFGKWYREGPTNNGGKIKCSYLTKWEIYFLLQDADLWLYEMKPYTERATKIGIPSLHAAWSLQSSKLRLDLMFKNQHILGLQIMHHSGSLCRPTQHAKSNLSTTGEEIVQRNHGYPGETYIVQSVSSLRVKN